MKFEEALKEMRAGKKVRKITMTFDELVDSYTTYGAAILFLKEKNPKISNENIIKVFTFVLKAFYKESKK